LVPLGGLLAVFQGDRIGNGTDLVTTLVTTSFFLPASVVTNLVEIPSVIASIIGSSIPVVKISPVMYYGLEMPFNVILITLSTLAGLIFALLPGIRKRPLSAVAFVVFMMIAIMMYPITQAGFTGSSGASPRVMAPLFFVAVLVFFTSVRLRRKFPSRVQGIWIFLAMPLASAIALLTIIRRFTNGQSESWLELFFEPKWWWEGFLLSPSAVWFIGVAGSLLVAYASLSILREPRGVLPSNGGVTLVPVNPEKPPETHMVPASNAPASRSRVGFGFSWLFSIISAWSLLRLPGELNPTANLFRGYFPDDQLSYAGIAASAKAGNFGLVEPFTQTGVSFYPSWWYKFIGQFASWTGLEIPAAWSFLGFCVVLGSVAVIGFAAYRISGKAWAPLVLGVLLWVGPLSSILFDNWFVNLNSHAVMWGPYGALYPLNAEAAGLSLGLSALVLGYWTLSRPNWSRNRRLFLFGVAGLGLGVIANFQTYSFLTLTAIVFWVLGVAGLQRSKSPRLLLISVAALVVVVLVAPFIRDSVGALPVYALMLVPALPGVWLFARERLQLFIVGFGLFLVGLAPQVSWMISGTLAQDPFLTYRVDQSGDLGVPVWAFVLLGSPILVTWAAILWAQIRRKGTAEISLLVGWFIAFVLLSFNNSWGFGQEPYRFWINSVIAFVVIATLTIPTVLKPAFRSSKGSFALSSLAVVLVAASMWNVGGFRSYVSDQGNKDFDDIRLAAISQVVAENYLGEGLISTDPCIDPRSLKVVTGAPVAFYNLGLAWPENKAEIDIVLDARNAGVMDVEALRAAGVTFLLTDTNCSIAWTPGSQMGVAQAASIEYLTDAGMQRIDFWQIV